MKLEFSEQIFEKYSNIKLRENPSSGSRVVPCGRTDRHDEANSRFSQFCEPPENWTVKAQSVPKYTVPTCLRCILVFCIRIKPCAVRKTRNTLYCSFLRFVFTGIVYELVSRAGK
jgi:hypothetical protein